MNIQYGRLLKQTLMNLQTKIIFLICIKQVPYSEKQILLFKMHCISILPLTLVYNKETNFSIQRDLYKPSKIILKGFIISKLHFIFHILYIFVKALIDFNGKLLSQNLRKHCNSEPRVLVAC